MKKALAWSLSIGAGAACLALTIPGAATAAPSGAAWRASSPTFPGRLYGVKAISASDVWAVGLTPNSSLAVHWNGSTWSSYESNSGYYNAVSASGPTDVWAAGGTNWFSPSQPLAEHWNGRSWTQVFTPNPAGGGYFNAVMATAPWNAWAVGLVGPGPGIPSPTTPLIEHWDGKHWTIQGFRVPANGGQFRGVYATSRLNAWAVGWTGASSEGTGQRTLIMHWNGRNWTRVPSPNAGIASVLDAVTVVSPANAWAVGFYIAGDGTYRALVMHWDGVRWTLVPGNTPGGDASLLGVTASWTHNIWAVGITNPTRCGHGPACGTLVEHWNGVRWKVLPSPNPPAGYLNLLWAVSAVSRSDIWAVGTTDYGSTLIEHWNGSTWS
jgi:hypothetical protein